LVDGLRGTSARYLNCSINREFFTLAILTHVNVNLFTLVVDLRYCRDEVLHPISSLGRVCAT
jgi:hypothetical protein